ncbi:MAG: hypothetical protein AAGF33_14370 [Pseudomonadota bacterium]
MNQQAEAGNLEQFLSTISEANMSIPFVLLMLVGGAAVVAALHFGQPIILFGLFGITGIAFAIFAGRQNAKAKDVWLETFEEDTI